MTQKIEIRTVGEPTLNDYSESEKTAFYTALFKRIQQLVKSDK